MPRQNDDTPALPQNIEAERSVLGANLLDNAALENAAALTPADFSYDYHRTIFAAILAMHAQHQAIDTITIGEYLGKNRQGKSERAGNPKSRVPAGNLQSSSGRGYKSSKRNHLIG